MTDDAKSQLEIGYANAMALLSKGWAPSPSLAGTAPMPTGPGLYTFAADCKVMVRDKKTGLLVGAMPSGKRAEFVSFDSLDDLDAWTRKKSEDVRPKEVGLFLTNRSLRVGKGCRQETEFHSAATLFADCDGTGSWTQLARRMDPSLIRVTLQESSSSTKRRDTGAADPDSLATGWHVVIPLSEPFTLKNPVGTPGWNHERLEFKRAQQHMFGVLAALAAFPGGDGFDRSTTQLLQARFIGSRFKKNGVLPQFQKLSGDRGLDFMAFLRETGFEWKPYTPPKSPVKIVQVLQKDGRKREVNLASGDQDLFKDVKARLSITDFLLNHVGCPVTQKGSGGDYHLCPVHHEETNPSGLSGGPNKTGFHVFEGEGGEQRWRCFGDCCTGGDLIHLAAAIWKIKPRAATERLAKLIGLDVGQYLTKRVVPQTPAFAPEDLELLEDEDPADTAEADEIRAEVAPASPTPAILEPDDDILVKILDTSDRGTFYTVQPPPKQKLATPYGEPHNPKPRAKLRTPVAIFKSTSDWLEDRVRDRPDAAKVARATGTLLLSRGLGQRERGVPFVPAHEPERIAATIESTLHERFDRGQAQGEVYDALDNLQNDRPEAGRRKLLGAVGPRAMHELTGAIWRDAFRDAISDMTENKLPTYLEYAKTIVGSDRVRSTPGNGWKLLHFVSEKVRKLEPVLPENPTAEQTAAWNAERIWHKSLVRQLTLPFGCLAFMNEHTVMGSGKVLSKAFVLCDSRACTGCSMAELTTEYELALPMWKKATAESNGVVFFVVLEVDTLEEATDLQQHMRKAGRPRLTATGFRNGRPTFMFVTLDLGDQSTMDSFATIWALRKAKRLGRPIERPQRFRIATTEEALGMVAELKLSFHVELAQRMSEVDEPRLLEFMRWAHRRQTIVTRSKKALPWPTKEQCKALRRSKREASEEELEDGQEMEIVTRHVETGMEVIRSRYPLTLERIIQAARANPQLQAAHKAAVLKRRADEEAARRTRRPRPTRPAKTANRERDPVAV